MSTATKRPWPELAHRFVVILGLIARAAGLYLRMVLDGRGLWRAREGEIERRLHGFARRYVEVATRFKGGLIKLGQVASLRIDVLPASVTDELARLQDRVEPHDVEEITGQIVRELGRPLDACFDDFEREALASASLGQVHRARSRDGSDLAVKVLYPGIERSVGVDLLGTRIALWLFDWIVVPDLMQVYRELRDAIHREMDYVREGRAAEEVARNLAQDPEVSARVRIPRIHWQTTTRRVLSMEFLEGVKINEMETLPRCSLDREEAVVWATRAFLHMMFRDGFFHCDPHPGNLLVDESGRIGIVDFGMNQRMAPEIRHGMRKNVMATVSRDVDLYVESLLDVGMIDPADTDTVREIAAMSFDPAYYNLTPQEMMQIDFGEYFTQMRAHMKRIRSFRLPEGIVMWSRAVSLLYALAVELAPGIRPLDVIGPYVLRFLQGDPPA